MAKVVLAVPTFRRPRGLKRLLDAVAELKTTASLEIIVADNDAGRREGAELVKQMAAGYRWPLQAIIVPERGIAQVRNALVEHALALPGTDFVAMLDDDEWPEPQWLEAFLKVQAETKADVVRGTILRSFDDEPPQWALRYDGLDAIRRPTGLVDHIDGTGNVLISRACFESVAKPYFDPGFALTGGEDQDFFVRLKAMGKRFAWADEALATEHVPASRMTLGWILKRAYRGGNSDMRVFLKNSADSAGLLRELVKIAGAVLLFPLLLAILSSVPNHRWDPVRTLCRNIGKIAALFGWHYHEYATIHGD